MVITGAAEGRGVEMFGYGFMAVRLIIYACVFFIFFEKFTVPLVDSFTGIPNYADNMVRPHKYRILFWVAVLEIVLFTA